MVEMLNCLFLIICSECNMKFSNNKVDYVTGSIVSHLILSASYDARILVFLRFIMYGIFILPSHFDEYQLIYVNFVMLISMEQFWFF